MNPYLTKSLVDEILPNSDYNALTAVVILLVCVHILHFILFGIENLTMLDKHSNKLLFSYV